MVNIFERKRESKKNKILATIIVAAVCVFVAFVILTKIIIPNSKYNDAIKLMNANKFIEAYEAFVSLDGYKDSNEKAKSIYTKYKIEKLKNAQIRKGDYVIFGAYEQDNNTANGKEDLEWLVLDVEDGKALLISKYAIDCKQYNTNKIDVTWETCTLRQWLNNDFVDAAFVDDEKTMISSTTVSADVDPEYNTTPGNATQDRVFLLSKAEACEYFHIAVSRQCEPTKYAVAGGTYVNDSYASGNCIWWLRSPGNSQDRADIIISYGSPDDCSVDSSDVAVRPVLWVDLIA